MIFDFNIVKRIRTHFHKLANFKYVMLAAVQACECRPEGAYGVTLQKELRTVGINTSLGAIYTTLDDLGERGWVTETVIPGGQERGYHAKSIYQVTALGADVLKEYATSPAKQEEVMGGRN